MSITTESAAYEIIKREGFAEGFEKGFEQGLKEGLEEGRKEKRMEIGRNSISLGILTIEQIASAMKLTVEQVRELKESLEKDA